MLYKKHPSHRTVCNESSTINKLSEYTQKLCLTKQTPTQAKIQSHPDSLSFAFSPKSRNIAINLQSSYTTIIKDLRQHTLTIGKAQRPNRKNEHIQAKIAMVLNQIKKTAPYYSSPASFTSKLQCIQNMKSKSRGRPKSKDLKLLEMRLMLDHPMKKPQFDSETIKSSLHKSSLNTNLKASSNAFHRRVLSETNQEDIANFSKEFTVKSRKRTSRNANDFLLKRVFSEYSNAKPLVGSPINLKSFASFT